MAVSINSGSLFRLVYNCKVGLGLVYEIGVGL